MANDKDKDDQDTWLQFPWLQRQVERRNPENALIRRWFKLADRVIDDKDDSGLKKSKRQGKT